MTIVTLIEATPLAPAGATTTTVRLGGGGRKPYSGHRGETDWRSGVIARPRFSALLPFENGGFSGGAAPTTGPLTFSSTDRALMDTLGGMFWKGAKLTMWTGDDALASPTWTVRMSGTVADHSFSENRLTLVVSDATEDLNVYVAPLTFQATGGIEGDTDARGRIKRRSLGRVFNIEGRILDKTNNVYEFGDPGRPLEQFVEIRDKGIAGPMTVIGWAGSAAATFTALQISTPPNGGACVAPSIACAKWWTSPAGPLTADLKGENTGGYVERVADIANRLVTGSTAITIGNVAAINALRTAPAGLHFDQSSETVTQALDRLLLPLTLLWLLGGDGIINIAQWTWTSPVETVKADTIARESVFFPLRNLRYGYKLNNRVQSDGEIASIVDDDIADALDEIEKIQSDGWLSAGEKPEIIRQIDRIMEELPDIITAAADLGLSSAAYQAAYNALMAYLNGLSPDWDDTDTDTPIDPSAFDAVFREYYSQRSTLKRATDAILSDARAEIEIIQADGWLSANEKPAIIRQWKAIQDEAIYFDSQADDFLVSRVAFDAARNALGTYLAGLTPAWNDTDTNTPIVGTTFNSRFTTYFDAREALDKSIKDKVKAIADGKIVTFRQGTTPTGQAVGDLWINTADLNHTYRWSGSSWVDAQDGDIALAAAAAGSAQTTADVKITTFFTTSTPTALSIGDLWYNTSTKIMKRWNSAAWVDVATLGADWLTTLTNVPTALTDGRVDAGLNADGTAKPNRVTTGAVVVGTVSTRGSSQLGSDTPATGSNQYLCSFNLNLIAGDSVFCTALGSCNYYGSIPDAEFRVQLNGGTLGMGTAVGALSYMPAGVAGFNYTATYTGSHNFRIVFRGGSSDVHLTDAIIMVDVARRNN